MYFAQVSLRIRDTLGLLVIFSMGNDNLGHYELSFLERLSSSQRVLYREVSLYPVGSSQRYNVACHKQCSHVYLDTVFYCKNISALPKLGQPL